MPKSQGSSVYLASRRWTATVAGQALLALDKSGLQLTAFAVREGLDPQRLARWRRRLAAPAAPVFEEIAPVEVTRAEREAGVGQEPFEVVLRSGRVVRVPPSFEVGALRRLLEVVDEVGPC